MENEPKIVNRRSEFLPMISKNRWITEFDDGSSEQNDYPTFIQQCNLCWKLVDSRNSKCVCNTVCCSDCKKECEKEKKCRLK